MSLFVNTTQTKRVTKRLREEIYYTRINELALNNIHNPSDRNFFRFHFNPITKIMYINYFEPPTKHWEKDVYNDIFKYFEVNIKIFFFFILKNSIIHPVNEEDDKKGLKTVFLKRNHEKMKIKRENSLANCLKINGIEFMVLFYFI